MRPAIGLMDRLSYVRKFLLISLVFLVPVGLGMYRLASETNQDIAVAEQELRGLQYLEALEKLHAEVMAAHLQADRPGPNEALERALAALQREQDASGAILQISAEHSALQKLWAEQRRTPLPADQDAAERRFGELLETMRTLRLRVGDASNLILDPEVASYHLMSVAVLHLPEVEDLAGKTLVMGRNAIEHPETAQDLIDLRGRLEREVEGVWRDFDAIRRNGSTVSLELAPLVQRHADTTRRLGDFVSQRTESEGSANARETLERLATEARDAVQALSDRSTSALRAVLEARVARLTAGRRLVFAGVFLSLALAAYLLLGFYAAVMRTVQEFRNTTERLTKGDMDASLHVSTSDELGQIARSFEWLLRRFKNEAAEARAKTARVSAVEARLRESESRTREILEAALDAVVTMDQTGRITGWNRSAETTFGWTAAEAVGQLAADLIVPPDRRIQHRDGLRRYVATGASPLIGTRQELSALTRDGEEIPVELSMVAGRTESGVAFSAFVRDISDRRRAEAELKAARDLAEDGSAAKSAFIARISDEVRTPMSGVIGTTELLLETSMTPDQREYVEMIRQSSESLLSMLNDVLDLSRVEAGKLDLDVATFDLASVIEGTVELLARPAQAKGLDLLSEIADGVPMTLEGDAARLRQVLLNLLGNAVKFTHVGEVAVSVSLVSSSEGEAVLRFDVRDTGIGIPVAAQPRLFQPFAQVNGSSTRRSAGTGAGLGLAVSRELVERMGGSIQVLSEPGKGSTFVFTARLAIPETTTLDGRDATIAGRRVLVADASPSVRNLLERQARRWGLLVESVATGPDVIAYLRGVSGAIPVDLVILDLNLPGADGLEVARAIRADASLNRTALMLLAPWGHATHDGSYREAGIDVCTTKPIRPSSIHRRLQQLLAKPASDAVPAAPSSAQPAEAAAEPGPLRETRVLIAEDNIVNQKVVSWLLHKRGYDVDVVNNGVEAVEAATREHYDIVLMDCQMPEMDGFEATRAIRDAASEAARGTVIVALTANAMKGDREMCLAAGMDDYLVKPVTGKALEEALSRWVAA